MDPYKILGVDRQSTDADIRTAYRKLAAKHHPDRGGDTATFQEIQAAYDILSDPNKRAAHDNPASNFRPFTDAHFHAGGNPFQDFVNQFFHQTRQKLYTITVFVTLEQIVQGVVDGVQINTPSGTKFVQLKLPPEIEDGTQIRYNGIMPDGALQVQFRIHRHPLYTKQGNDLYATVEVNVLELITGSSIIINDIHGKNIEIKINPMTKPGTKLRLPGHGINGGSQFVLIAAKLPDRIGNDTLNQIQIEVSRGKNG